MATIEEFPQTQIRTQSHDRIIKTCEALERLRSGGTATDVQQTLIDMIEGTVSVMTVRRDLWLLHNLGLARWSQVENARWWHAIKLKSDPIDD